MKNWHCRFRILACSFILLSCASWSLAGVSRLIQEQYKKGYENKALYLKIPIYTEKQMIYITGQNIRVEQGLGAPRYKVGDQLRVLEVDFGGDEIKLRLGGIAAPGVVEIGFKFDAGLQESFPNREVFDRALQSTLTEGLRYTDIDDAKDAFVKDQFDRAVREIAGSASISRDAALKNIAQHLPAYQEAQRDIENLKSRVQDISAQLSQSQSENRKMDSESRAQQAELSRLKNTNASMQEKLDSYTAQISRLGDEVRDARGNAQGYQKELANIQRSLNMRVEAGRDLTAQIADLGQALKKLQKENESLSNQINSLRENLAAQQTVNERLTRDNEELKAGNRNLQSTLATLTSSKDSLGRQYLNLKAAKEKLDDLNQAIDAVRTLVVEESTVDGMHRGKAQVYLSNVLLGSLDWSLPAYLNKDETGNAEASFSVESIDYMRATPEERRVLRSLGESFKVRVAMDSTVESMEVTASENQPVRELGERDRSSWRWSVRNSGARDGRLRLTVRLINKDANEISIVQQDRPVAASNVVRQMRGYLQPVPLVAGIVIGFLLFGIVGIFRKPKARRVVKEGPLPPSHPGKKQL